MVKRWTHGHSLGAGTLAGLALSHDPLLLVGAGFAAGVAATLVALGGYRLARALLGVFGTWRASSRVCAPSPRTRPEPVYGGRARAPYADIPY